MFPEKKPKTNALSTEIKTKTTLPGPTVYIIDITITGQIYNNKKRNLII